MSALLLFGRTEELYSLLDSSKSAVWIMSFTGFIINQTWTIETYIIGKFSQFSQGQDFVFRNSGEDGKRFFVVYFYPFYEPTN